MGAALLPNLSHTHIVSFISLGSDFQPWTAAAQRIYEYSSQAINKQHLVREAGGVMAPSPDYGRRCVSEGNQLQRHDEIKSMLIKQAGTFTDNQPWQQCVPSLSLTSAPVSWVSRKVKCLTLGPDGSLTPAGWGGHSRLLSFQVIAVAPHPTVHR